MINLFDEEEQLPFYRSDINPPPKLVIDYRNRLEDADVLSLVLLIETQTSLVFYREYCQKEKN